MAMPRAERRTSIKASLFRNAMRELMKRIVLPGGSGFLGQALATFFQQSGHEVVVLRRSPIGNRNGVREVAWDARTMDSWKRELEGATAVINLTGKSVNCRYT